MSDSLSFSAKQTLSSEKMPKKPADSIFTRQSINFGGEDQELGTDVGTNDDTEDLSEAIHPEGLPRLSSSNLRDVAGKRTSSVGSMGSLGARARSRGMSVGEFKELIHDSVTNPDGTRRLSQRFEEIFKDLREGDTQAPILENDEN